MTKSAKQQSGTKRGRDFPFKHMRLEQFKSLIKEAAEDTGGGGYTPGIYKLIAECVGPNSPEGLRYSVISACVDFVKNFLERATRREAVVFFMLLTRAELWGDSTRLQQALFEYVDKHIASISPNTADIAVRLLQRGAGQSNARTWLPILRQQLLTKPSWPAIDVLVEMTFLLENEYSRGAFMKDLEHLRNSHDFGDNIKARQRKWARLGMLIQEILSDTQSKSIFNGDLSDAVTKLTLVQGGQHSGNGKQKIPNVSR